MSIPPAGAAQPPADPADPTPPPYQPPAAPAYGQQAYGQPVAPAAAQPSPYGTPSYPAYATAPAYGGYPTQKTNTLAIVSLIASLVGIFILPFVGSVAGIITGHISLSQIKRTGEGGRGLGLAGTIVGWVGLALSILGTILIVAWIAWIGANYNTIVPA